MVITLALHRHAAHWRLSMRGHRRTPKFIIATLVLVTLLCLPVVVLQHNWAGLTVVVVALTVSTRELMTAIRRDRRRTPTSHRSAYGSRVPGTRK
jgi:hypothetical protein